MKYIYLIISIFLYIGCAKDIKIKLNDSVVQFSSFPSIDTLKFVAISNQLLEEPSKMLLQGDKMIIETFCKAKDKHIAIYSLSENRIINEIIKYGEGPDEMLSCDIDMVNNKLWLYDISKKRIGFIPIDSLLLDTPNIIQHKTNAHYYNTAMLNDSIMLGTNDMSKDSKIAYVNINTNSVTSRGKYAYLDQSIALEALIDASSCYINVNPATKDILLSYRYTDMIEIYNSEGEIKYALQGPKCFDIEFQAVKAKGHSRMAKTQKTRKAYVNSYVTKNAIYLLMSGCKRNEKDWANGTEIHVFSWDGEPKKQYVLKEPIYTFAIDEDKRVIYSYSLQTEELLKAML